MRRSTSVVSTVAFILTLAVPPWWSVDSFSLGVLLPVASSSTLRFGGASSRTPQPGSRIHHLHIPQQRERATPRRSSSSSDDNSNEPERADRPDADDYAREETLLCLDLFVQPGVSPDQARAKVSQFCQSFPFAAVLPVQPLQYLPVYEDGGVEVKFLRKKTDLKSAIDGGVRFFIETLPLEEDDDDEDENDDDNNDNNAAASSTTTRIEVTAKRNSKGQTIAKLMAEKLIVTNFVAAITGEPEARQRLGSHIPMEEYVLVRSIYHKWM